MVSREQTVQQSAAFAPVLLAIALVAICTPLNLSIAGIALNPIRIVMLVSAVPLLFMLMTGKFGRISVVDILILAFCLWLLVSIAANNPDRVVQFAGSNTLDFLGGYLIGRATIRNADDFQRFIKLLLLLLILMLIPALIESQTGRPPILDILSRAGLPALADVMSDRRLGLERAQVVFPHPIHYGVFASSILAFVFIGLRDALSLVQRLLACGVVVLSTVLSVSSGALLPLLLQTLLIGWALALARVERRWLILVIIVTVLFIIVEVLSERPAIIAILSRLAFNSHNVYMRSVVFEWGMINIWANPIFGLGLHDWVRPEWMHSASTDNFWILLAMRHGIPGFAFLAMAFAALLIGVGRRRFTPGGRLANCQLAWMLMMISMILSLSTVAAWGNLLTYLMLVVASGHWLVSVSEDQGTEPKADAPAVRMIRYTRFPPQSSGGEAVS